MDRRQFLSGMAGAAAVLGFNPTTRSWVTRAQADDDDECRALPRLDGEVVTDQASRLADSSDVGNIVHRTPVAILRPGSAEDVVKMVRYCKRCGIKVAARGQGHTTGGQGLVNGGLIVEMSKLNTIHAVGPGYADVDAGVLWKTLVEQVVPAGQKPPVLTSFIGLTIGGTLSVGGVPSSNNVGTQVEYVQKLQVVTGEGELLWCSQHHHRELFEMALGGLGQCGLIVRAVVTLVPAKPLTHVMLLNYHDLDTCLADMHTLLGRGELDDVFILWVPLPTGGFLHQIDTAIHFDPANPPDTAHLLRGMRADSQFVVDIPYLFYAERIDAQIDQLKAAGMWDNVKHPWFDVWLPGRSVDAYVRETVGSLQLDDVGLAGFMLLFPQRRSNLTRPLMRVPDDEWVYLFDILTSAPLPGENPAFVSRMLSRNRRLFEVARAAGGTRYPIGIIPFEHRDWVEQYGEVWRRFERNKDRFDPNNVLTPGPGIFDDER